jgi:hypothetical protein
MAQQAGIAISRLAYDAEFVITRVDGTLDSPTFSPPDHYKLVEGHTVKEILYTFDELVGIEIGSRRDGFAISVPMIASYVQRDAFSDERHFVHDHSQAWANAYARDASREENVKLLFIDLTPGQIESALLVGNIDRYGTWWPTDPSRRASLDDENQITIQDVIDRLIDPIIPDSRKVHQIGILHPEGELPDLSLAELESRLPDVLSVWVTLDYLSYGAAVLMHRRITMIQPHLSGPPDATDLPMGIALASGQIVTVISMGESLPVIQKIILTNSQDDQATASIRLFRGTTLLKEIMLEGLAPRPRGKIRIKVTFNITRYSLGTVTIEEVSTGLTKETTLETVFSMDWEEIQAYKEATKKQVDMELGEDGVIGELPE